LNERQQRDRRTRPRFDVVGELWGSLETPTTLAIQNIGRGGALLESPVALPVDSIHRVMLAAEGEQIETLIRVRHSKPIAGAAGDPEGYFIGVEFLALSRRAATIVDGLIQGERES
jgi:hypothetical protein